MKQINKLWAAGLVALVLCVVLQSCSSSKNGYGCPERIGTTAELMP